MLKLKTKVIFRKDVKMSGKYIIITEKVNTVKFNAVL